MSNLHRQRKQPYNVRILNYLLENKSTIDKSQLAHLMAIQTATVGLNEFPTEYNFKISKKDRDCSVAKLSYGRIYGNVGSAEYLDYNYRNNLFAKTEHDIDMKNCHPTLLCQLAKKNGFTCTALEEYVAHREEYFEQVMAYYSESGLEKSRAEVKTEVIASLYGAKIPVFKSMKSDLDYLTTKLKEEHATLYETVDKLKQVNKNGAFLSYIAQTEERKCLDAMDSYYLQQGRSVDGLAYDGLMVRKLTPEEKFPDELLRGAERFVKEKTGYEITLEIKPMVQDIDDSALRSRDEKMDDSYAKMKVEFEKKHFYLEPTNTVVRVEECGKRSSFKLDHAKVAFNGMKVEHGGKTKLFFDMWIKDGTRRTIRRLVFKVPEDCEEDEYSLFVGFAYKRIKETPSEEQCTEYITLFNDLLSAICGDEDIITEDVRKRFAQMIQHPFVKTNVLTAFASKDQGTGKDTIMLIMKWLIGDAHTAHYKTTSQYWDKHDVAQEGAIFVYLEEACSNLNKEKTGELKSRISADTITMNPKGFTPYEVPNVGRQFMTSNFLEPFKVEEGDRRGLLIHPNTRNSGRNWGKTYDIIGSKEFQKAIGEYLENYDLSGWNCHRAPETAFKKEMKQLAKSSENIFFEQWDPEEEWVGATVVYDAYSAYCDRNSLPRAQNVVSFGKRIIPLINVSFKRKSENGYNVYSRILSNH